MQWARVTCLGLGLGLVGTSVGATPRAELVLLRLANLTTAPESARIGFALALDGPPLVDELPAGALTTLLPGQTDLAELWVLPRGQVLPKSLPEPLQLTLAGPGRQLGGAQPATVTLFLIDRPGPRGELVRHLVTGAQAPAEAAQLRILNLLGSPALDVCMLGESAVPVARAVPAWGLSAFTPAAPGPAAAGLLFRVAAEPACSGPKLAAVQPRLTERGAWTLVTRPAPSSFDRKEGSPALQVLLLDEGSFLPERAVPLPVSLPPQGSALGRAAAN